MIKNNIILFHGLSMSGKAFAQSFVNTFPSMPSMDIGNGGMANSKSFNHIGYWEPENKPTIVPYIADPNVIYKDLNPKKEKSPKHHNSKAWSPIVIAKNRVANKKARKQRKIK